MESITIDNPMRKTEQVAPVGAIPIPPELIALKSARYADLLAATQPQWPAVPDVEIRYEHLTYTVPIPLKAADVHRIPTVFSAIRDMALALPRAVYRGVRHGGDGAAAAASHSQDFHVLQGVSGVLRPGRMALILAPPGHSKSSLLQVLASRVPSRYLSGSVTYSGLTAEQAKAKGINIHALLGMAEQVDTHTPQLTVRETLQFAAHNSNVPARELPPALQPVAAARVDTTLRLLGLQECEKTYVGDEVLRGISGGQRKRLTVAETLVQPARALLLDEISSGLDSAVTEQLVEDIRAWARASRGTVMAALLQPTPETYALFDDVVLLCHGRVVYHGPREQLPGYFASLGYAPPRPADTAATDTGAATVTGSQDMAEWIVEMLNNPAKAAADAAAPGPLPVTVPVTAEALAAAWTAHPLYQTLMATPTPTSASASASSGASSGAATPELALTSSYAQAQYGRLYSRSALSHFVSILGRQLRLQVRDPVTMWSKVAQAVVMGLILGSLFWKLDTSPSGAFLKLSLSLFAIINCAFSNFSEIPAAMATRFVVYRELDAHRYPAPAYLAALIVATLPLALMESIIFSVILYTMSGFSNDPGRLGFFILILFLVSIALAGYFRLVAFIMPSAEASNAATGPVVSILVVFSGYLISRESLPRWLLGAFYGSPFSWALTALAQNEFYSSAYNSYPDPRTPSKTLGRIYLESYEILTEPEYEWGACLYLLLVFALFGVCATAAVQRVRHRRQLGTSRISALDDDEKEEQEEEKVAAATDAVTIPVPATKQASPSPSASASLPASPSHHIPFTPMCLTFTDVRYEVKLPRRAGGGTRQLLRGVSGYAKPGQITALMGASGAGKTTLLDCLAGRKNSGKLEGAILINGAPATKETMARHSCYCEQQDVHMPLTTVREALEFSAGLRLPAGTARADRSAAVEEVLGILEMRHLADRLVGDDSSATGLSPGERKRLTIGVELISGASIVAADEPTSFLDARSAAVVMRVLRRIADTGRTVIMTVHQPSETMFLLCDSLLLLSPGGYEVYCGPLGPGRASSLVTYLSAIPGVPPCGDTNPASWMLTVLAAAQAHKADAPAAATAITATATAAGTDSPTSPAPAAAAVQQGQEAVAAPALAGTDFCALYHASPLYAAAKAEIERLVAAARGDTAAFAAAAAAAAAAGYARSWPVQFGYNLRRNWRSYQRNVQYNVTRCVGFTVLAIIFGAIYYKIGVSSIGGIISAISVLFLCTAFSGVLSFGTVLGVLLGQRATFYRERSSKLYSSSAYSAANMAVELPWVAGQALVFSAIIYYMVGFKAGGEAWVHFALTFFLCCLSYNVQGQLLAGLFPNLTVAQAVGGLLMTLGFLFAGLFCPGPAIPAGWKWIYVADPIRYALEGLAMTQFWCEGGVAAGCPAVEVITPQGPVSLDVGTYVAEYFGMDFANRWSNVGILAIFVGIFAVLNALTVRFISHVRR